ncbi:MAG: hypothetical protein ACTSRZ_07925 [Promethearchaeota archaeon]
MSQNNVAYLLETPFGLLLLDKEGNLLEYENLDLNPLKLAAMYIKIKNKEKSDLLDSFINKLNKLNVDEIIAENDFFKEIKEITKPINLDIDPIIYKRFRENLPNILKTIMPNKEINDFSKLAKEIVEKISREGIREFSESSDIHIKYLIDCLEDTMKFINTYSLRLREWYGVHFPEFTDSLVSDIKRYAQIVKIFQKRENIKKEKLIEYLELDQFYAEKIEEYAKYSMGGEITDIPLSIIIELANKILELIDFKEFLEKKLEEMLAETAPNLLELLGAQLAGKLINLAGSLKELALMPSSTIQIIGAEKALFRALRKKGASPKHGIIYIWHGIRNAKLWQRGKISRLLAGKISICAKLDYFKGDFRAKEIIEDLNRKIEHIKKVYANPPKKARSIKKGNQKEIKNIRYSKQYKQKQKRPKSKSKSKYKQKLKKST